MPKDDRLRETLNKVEDYEETVIAIITFSHEVCWDSVNKRIIPDSLFMIGRRMGKINNAENSEHTLTPDIVIQLNGSYGIIAEVKKSFPKEKSYWDETFQQINRYDNDLIGWATDSETIKKYDLALLTHITRKVDVTDYYREQHKKGKYNFKNKFAIVAFNRGGEGKEYMYLEKHYGDFTDANLDERLRKVVSIPMEKVLPLYPIKFYDSPPPMPYLLDILWANIFPQFLFLELSENEPLKYSTIKVDVSEVTKRLQKQFSQMRDDDRQQEIPKQDWIKEAMEALVRLKLAKRVIDNPNIYEVEFKTIRDPLTHFAMKITKPKKRKNIPHMNQILLPEIDSN